MKKIGLYVHIPFCKRKCFYCDFCSYADKIDLQEKYVQVLTKEIVHKSKQLKETDSILVDTIYIGGGTPSIIKPEYIKQILSIIRESYNVCKDAEITIEVNPGTVNDERIEIYKEAGVNRVSIGLQSASDTLLEKIGRIHNYKDFERAYESVKKAGIDNINVDLMIGLPDQTVEDVKDTLKALIQKNPKHISVYSLIIEPGTVIEELLNDNKLKLPEEETERKMYWLVKEELEKNGYNQYEISNFSRPGFESKHNVNCWNQHEYMGFGIAAHSYMNKTRYSNICNLEKYIDNIENEFFEKNEIVHEYQKIEDTMKEYMILGLRKLDGVSIDKFYNKFNKSLKEVFKSEIEKLMEEGLIEEDKDEVKLSKKGLDFANVVWAEFI